MCSGEGWFGDVLVMMWEKGKEKRREEERVCFISLIAIWISQQTKR